MSGQPSLSERYPFCHVSPRDGQIAFDGAEMDRVGGEPDDDADGRLAHARRADAHAPRHRIGRDALAASVLNEIAIEAWRPRRR